MAKPAPHSAFDQVALSITTAAAVGSFAFSLKAQWAWVFVIPCVVSLFWRIQRLPTRLIVWTRYAAWIALAGALLIGLLHRTYPVLSDEAAQRPMLIAGFCLAFFACLFLIGTNVWRPAESLVPSVLGVFLIAAFNPLAQHLHVLVALAGFGAFAYLLMSGRTFESSSEARRLLVGQFTRIGVSALAVFLIAGSIIQVLPWLQVRVVQATNRFSGPQFNYYAGLSRDSTLGDLAELHLSQKMVMRIWTSLPQKLRGRVFTRFDGRAWHAIVSKQENLMPESKGLLDGSADNQNSDRATWLNGFAGSSFGMPGRHPKQGIDSGEVRTKIVQIVFNDGLLVSPGNKVLVRLSAPYLRVDTFENLSPPPQSSVEIYGVVNRAMGGVVQEGAATEESMAQCLILPDQTDGRLKEVARRLALGAGSPAERVQRTLNYLQSQCHYSLKVGEFHSQQPVAEFLFEKKQGYCEYFASAAAVLLRLEGVPARYVTGFNVQEGNRQGSHYVVRESDAHAWDEVYLPDKGWVEIDPTPESEYAALHSDLKGGWLATAVEGLAAMLEEVSARIAQGDWLATLRWIGNQFKLLLGWALIEWLPFSLLLFVLVVAWAVLRARRKKTSTSERAHKVPLPGTLTTPAELVELVHRLDTLWAREGFQRPPSRAPLEHLGSIPAGKISPSLRQSSRRIIESYYQTSFGGAPFSPSEARELRQALEQANANRAS